VLPRVFDLVFCKDIIQYIYIIYYDIGYSVSILCTVYV
jgi:hypothetical protein